MQILSLYYVSTRKGWARFTHLPQSFEGKAKGFSGVRKWNTKGLKSMKMWQRLVRWHSVPLSYYLEKMTAERVRHKTSIFGNILLSPFLHNQRIVGREVKLIRLSAKWIASLNENWSFVYPVSYSPCTFLKFRSCTDNNLIMLNLFALTGGKIFTPRLLGAIIRPNFVESGWKETTA